MSKAREKVFVAMSGGVDSSVAALLLKQEGYDIVGVFMRCYNLDGCAERDAEDARRVAAHLGIPFYSWDFEEEYKKRVVEYMVEGYRQGITPNPDVMCNREIKFGVFLKKALAMGADYVATGHYVRLKRESLIPSTRFARPAARSLVLAGSPPGRTTKRADRAEPATRVSENQVFSLFAAKDKGKDQSYFLWTLTQNQLRYCLFPIGDYKKTEVRAIARRAGLPTADKKDSQGICFLGKITLADFLKRYIPEKHGEVFTTAGKKVGEHSGAYFYTIGQRHGLGISGAKPYYVSEKDTSQNTIVVAEGEDHPALYRKELELVSVNWISGVAPRLPLNVFARVRYRQKLAPVRIARHGSGVELVFRSPQKFVAAGQSAVFYGKDGEMLGGGVIV